MLVLQLQNVRKNFGERRVLRDISFAVEPGECVVVAGANGSGKSTLLKIVVGLLRPTSGTVTIDSRTESVDRRKAVAYAAPDVAFYPELSARENLHHFVRVAGWETDTPRIQERLEYVGLGRRGDDTVSVFSSGMIQRLRLAFATLRQTPLLLLDEPSLALDALGVALVGEIVAKVKANGGAVLLATNDAREAALGDRTIALDG